MTIRMEWLSLHSYVHYSIPEPVQQKKICYGKNVHFVLFKVFNLGFFGIILILKHYLDPNPNFFFGVGFGSGQNFRKSSFELGSTTLPVKQTAPPQVGRHETQ
jgi:hypothetical protein